MHPFQPGPVAACFVQATAVRAIPMPVKVFGNTRVRGRFERDRANTELICASQSR